MDIKKISVVLIVVISLIVIAYAISIPRGNQTVPNQTTVQYEVPIPFSTNGNSSSNNQQNPIENNSNNTTNNSKNPNFSIQ